MGFTPSNFDYALLRGRQLSNESALKILYGKCTSSANSVSTLFSGSAVYQVPASKKFIYKAAFVNIVTAATGNSRFSIGYGDNNTGYATGSAAPTNAVWALGQGFTNGWIFPTTVTGNYEILLPALECPANKYPVVEAVPDTGSPLIVFCILGYEVAA